MQYIYVGDINGTHGLRGELKLKTSFKYIDKVLVEGFNFYVGDSKIHVILKKSRTHNKNELLTFKDREDINLVEDLRNNRLYVRRDDLYLDSDEYVFEDYLNLECYFNDKCIGKVCDVVNCGGNNYVLVVRGKKEILIPLNSNFIDKLEVNNRIVLKEVGDLIDEN